MIWKIRKFLKYGSKYSKVSIAKNVELNGAIIDDFANIAHDASIINSKIGNYTSIGRYTKIQNANIGKFCSISWDVTVGATEHPINHITTHAFPYRTQFNFIKENKEIEKQLTVIGNDVWIGCGVIIKSGITIGDGAIIGAGAVVTKDVEPYAIVAGVPAKLIKYRFSESDIKFLTTMKWWDLPNELIKNNIELFQQPLTEEILNELKEKIKSYEKI